jgi:succinoglycan biosynthesis transport protein ExoP
VQLAELLGVLQRRWVYVVLPMVVAVGAAAFLSLSAAKIYEATASVYFARPAGNSTSELLQGATYTQQQLASYASLVTKPILLDRVIDDLDLDITAEELARQMSALVSSDTVIVDVRASSPSPDRASRIANSAAENLQGVVEELTPASADDMPTVTATVVAPAPVPSVPSSPNTRLNLLAGLVGGLMLGVLAAIARDRLDTRVRRVDDLPDGLPVLASVPVDRGAEKSPAAVVQDRSPLRAESFRRLRTNLRFASVDERPIQVLAVVSAMPGEGKTSTALNLARVLAHEGHRTLIIDSDLRLPRAADYLGAVSEVGLADVLVARLDVEAAIQPTADGLDLLAAGTIPPNPSELIGSKHMAELLSSLRRSYEYIVIDTPALLPVTDGSLVASLSDGVVVVAAHGKTRHNQLVTALQSLSTAGSRVLGVVLNRVPRSKVDETRRYGPYLEAPRQAAASTNTPRGSDASESRASP